MDQATVPPPIPPADQMQSPRSGLATASLVFGILSWCCLGPFGAIPALILGIIALVKIGNAQGKLRGTGMAITGLTLGGVLLVLLPFFAAIMLPALARARESARRSACQGQLKQMGLVYKLFANESKGQYFPELSSEPGRLMCVSKDIFPEILTDAGMLVCPSDPEIAASKEREAANASKEIGNVSYMYLGYVIMSDDEMEAFAEAYKQRIAQKLPFNEDMDAPPGRGSMGTDKFYRLREGVENVLLKDANDPASGVKLQSKIPVMWDTMGTNPQGNLFFNHIPGGGNVLFMDGHVEFLRCPGPWPMSKRGVEILSELAAMKP